MEKPTVAGEARYLTTAVTLTPEKAAQDGVKVDVRGHMTT
jgi:hypothetical protein